MIAEGLDPKAIGAVSREGAAPSIAAGGEVGSIAASGEVASSVSIASSEEIASRELPEGVLVARVGAGANCSSAGSAIDILFYTSVIAGAIAVALSAAFPPRPRADDRGGDADGSGGDAQGPGDVTHAER